MTGYHDIARMSLALVTAYMNRMDDEAAAIHASFQPGDAEQCLAFTIGMCDWAVRQISADNPHISIDAILAGIGQGIETVAASQPPQ